MRARSELRSDRRSLVGLALILGLICGVVLTAAEGARRTDTAYPRFVASVGSPGVFVISGKDPHGPVPVVDLQRAIRLPQVSFGVIGRALSGVAESMNGDVLWGGDLNLGGVPNDQALRQTGWGAKLLAGRFPDPNRADEAVVGYREHPDPRMGVGDRIRIALLRPDVPESILFNGVGSKDQVLPPVTVKMPMRSGGLIGASSANAETRVNDSKNGSANSAPAPRMKLRREGGMECILSRPKEVNQS